MALLTSSQYWQLLFNGNALNAQKDNYPVVKLYIPGIRAQWLLTELDNDLTDLAFGLCDAGFGYPELNYISFSELESNYNQGKNIIQRDNQFVSNYPISVYAQAAMLCSFITEDERLLRLAANMPIGSLRRFYPQP